MRDRDIPLRHNSRDVGRKMSECLAELIDPYVQDQMPAEPFRVLVGVGAIAWNLSVVSSEDPSGELREILGDVDLEPENRQLFSELVGELRRRKERLFPDDDRIIASWDVEQQGAGRYFLTAASVTSAPESAV